MVRRSLTAPTLGAHRPHFPRGGPGRHWVLVQLQRLRARCGLWNGRGRRVRPWVDGYIAGCWAGRGAKQAPRQGHRLLPHSHRLLSPLCTSHVRRGAVVRRRSAPQTSHQKGDGPHRRDGG